MKTKRSHPDKATPCPDHQDNALIDNHSKEEKPPFDPVTQAVDDILAAALSVTALAQDRAKRKMSNNRANGVVRELKDLAKVISRYGCELNPNRL